MVLAIFWDWVISFGHNYFRRKDHATSFWNDIVNSRGVEKCREPAERSFEIMKNITRENDEVLLKNMFHESFLQ